VGLMSGRQLVLQRRYADHFRRLLGG